MITVDKHKRGFDKLQSGTELFKVLPTPTIPCKLRDRGECDCADDECLLRDCQGKPLQV